MYANDLNGNDYLMADAVIKSTLAGSIAEEIGLCRGDRIIKINGSKINDVLDYRFLSCDEELELEILHADGEAEIIDVYTGYEDLGIEFENSLMDTPKSCRNKCIFCFIDQLPKGMRETVYFKDDDARLSFLQGNYITLTNLNDKDIDRIIKMRISPVNVSVHTTNPELRKMMLGNRFAGKLYPIMQRLAENKIHMNCQIVLCPDINDGDELERTLNELGALAPYVTSISAVPVGLSAHREGLYPLKPYTRESAAAVIKQIENKQKEFHRKYGSSLIYASDEFYLMAGIGLPCEKEYEGYPQIENGVGLITSMEGEFTRALCEIKPRKMNRHVSIATGELAYDFICSLSRRLEKHCEGMKIDVYGIKNNFFGGGVNVSGLVCACDIYEQLKNSNLGEALYIPASMLRADDEIFLDDVTLGELENKLNIKIIPVLNDGYEFAQKLLNISEHTEVQHLWQNR